VTADVMGVSYRTMLYYVNGDRPCPAERVNALANKYGLDKGAL